MGATVTPVNGSNVSVSVANQTVSDETVTVDVTLPEGGYVVVHGGRYVFDGVPSPIGRTGYLAPGRHTVTVDVAPRAFPPGTTGRIAAVAHRDTGGDEAFTRYAGNLSADVPYRTSGGGVADTATVTAPATTTSSVTPTGDGSNATVTLTATPDASGGGLSPVEVASVILGALLSLVGVAVLLGRGDA